MSRPKTSRDDARWALWSGLIVAGVLAFSMVVGLVVLPLAQAPNANLDAWTAICRAVGLKPGTPAQRQPPFDAKAAPVSQVRWTPRTLHILGSADARPGASLAAAVCSNCHGEDGLSTNGAYPRLAGQSPEAIYKQLSDYRSGARFDPQMTPVAQGLTSDQLAEVAAYFGRLQKGSALGRASVNIADPAIARLVLRGDPSRAIAPCESCHARGAGGPPEAPVLLGQNEDYLVRQLTAYRSGGRRNDVYRRMRAIAERLTPGEVRAVARYYQGVY